MVRRQASFVRRPATSVRRQATRWRRAAAITGAALVLVLGAATPALATSERDKQWHLDSLRIEQVHKISTGKGVVVAVVDTGVQADHPDLAGRVLNGASMSGDEDRGQVDRQGHGTGVAGLIAASGKRGGALGVAPDAKILPVTITLNGEFGGSNAAQGVRWAADHGADVINLSMGGSTDNDDLAEAVRYALGKDIVVVAAGGNAANRTEITTPANVPGVIAVSATQRDGKVWAGGLRGPELALSAPGTRIHTLANQTADFLPGGYQTVAGGTSASAPIVAGAAALIRSKYPDLRTPDVVNRLISTAVDAGPTGRDDQYGFGRLDILAALTTDVPPVKANPLGDPPAPGQADGGTAADSDKGSADSLTTPLLVGVVGFGLLILVAIVIVVIVLVRRQRSTPPPRYGPGPGPGPHGPHGPHGPRPPAASGYGAPPSGTASYGAPPGAAGPYGAPGYGQPSGTRPHQPPHQPPPSQPPAGGSGNPPGTGAR